MKRGLSHHSSTSGSSRNACGICVPNELRLLVSSPIHVPKSIATGIVCARHFTWETLSWGQQCVFQLKPLAKTTGSVSFQRRVLYRKSNDLGNNGPTSVILKLSVYITMRIGGINPKTLRLLVSSPILVSKSIATRIVCARHFIWELGTTVRFSVKTTGENCEPGAHYPEFATLSNSCHGIFADREILFHKPIES